MAYFPMRAVAIEYFVHVPSLLYVFVRIDRVRSRLLIDSIKEQFLIIRKYFHESILVDFKIVDENDREALFSITASDKNFKFAAK